MDARLDSLTWIVMVVAIFAGLQGLAFAWLAARVWRLEARADAVDRRLRFRLAEPDQSAAAGT